MEGVDEAQRERLSHRVSDFSGDLAQDQDQTSAKKTLVHVGHDQVGPRLENHGHHLDKIDDEKLEDEQFEAEAEGETAEKSRSEGQDARDLAYFV